MIELFKTFVNTIYSKILRHFIDYGLYLVVYEMNQVFIMNAMGDSENDWILN